MKLHSLGCEGWLALFFLIGMLAVGFFTLTGWIAQLQGVHVTYANQTYATQWIFIFTLLDLGLLAWHISSKSLVMLFVWPFLLAAEFIYVSLVLRGFPVH